MFVRDGDVDIGCEAAKYVHSLRRRGVSRVGTHQLDCKQDQLRARHSHHNLWGRLRNSMRATAGIAAGTIAVERARAREVLMNRDLLFSRRSHSPTNTS